MNITIEQLEDLLRQQRVSCSTKSQQLFNESELKGWVDDKVGDDSISNKFYHIRDGIMVSEFPEDFKILKKYNVE